MSEYGYKKAKFNANKLNNNVDAGKQPSSLRGRPIQVYYRALMASDSE